MTGQHVHHGADYAGRHALLHVAGADPRAGLQLQVGHLVAGLPAVRDGRAPVALLRREDDPLLALQEDRELRLSAAALRPLLGCGGFGTGAGRGGWGSGWEGRQGQWVGGVAGAAGGRGGRGSGWEGRQGQ